MDLTQALNTVGVDVETTLRRFGNNQALLERFVRKFPQDDTYNKLSQAVGAGDLAEIERAAHTLKGTSANLGFQTLSDICRDMVQAVREGKMTAEQMQTLMANASAEYEKIMVAIKLLD